MAKVLQVFEFKNEFRPNSWPVDMKCISWAYVLVHCRGTILKMRYSYAMMYSHDANHHVPLEFPFGIQIYI